MENKAILIGLIGIGLCTFFVLVDIIKTKRGK
jgi:hypothetical protein